MVATKTCFTVVDLFKPLYVKTHYKWPVMPKMARNRSALHDVLAQGASNRDITVYVYVPSAKFSTLRVNTGHNYPWKYAAPLQMHVFVFQAMILPVCCNGVRDTQVPRTRWICCGMSLKLKRLNWIGTPSDWGFIDYVSNLFWGKHKKIYWHFIMYKMARVSENPPCVRQGHIYSTQSIPWLLMACRLHKPGHQQTDKA